MPRVLQAGLWGLVAGSALLIGAAVGYLATLPQRLIAAIMAFGGGVLISALSFELMDDAYHQGGFPATPSGSWAGPSSTARPTSTWPAAGPSTASARTASSPPRPTRAAAGWPSRSAPCWTASPSRSSSG